MPWRLLFDKTKEFFGENNESAWTNNDSVTLPSASFGDLDFDLSYTLWDYFGLPVGAGSYDLNAWQHIGFNVMPFRGYKLIYNEYFRNQNTTAPLMVNTTQTDEIDADYFAIQRGCRLHDIFSDCLPAPQKGPDVLIPGLSSLPVVTGSEHGLNPNNTSMRVSLTSGGLFTGSKNLIGFNGVVRAFGTVDTSSVNTDNVFPSNLYTAEASNATIRSLRDAFQIQRIYERDARSGTRYTEYLRAAFDVVSPDASLQRPQFLGTYRMALNMSQVIQNSASTEASLLVTLQAFPRLGQISNSPPKVSQNTDTFTSLLWHAPKGAITVVFILCLPVDPVLTSMILPLA